MKIYGEIHRQTIPAETVTREVYYILEETPKEVIKNNRKIRRQQRHANQAIIFLGITVAYGVWALCNKLKETKE